MSRLPAAFAAIASALLPAPGLAQNVESEADRRIEALVTAQKATTEVRDRRCELGDASAGEIVVCAPSEPEADRYPGREDTDAARSTSDGRPRAPDLRPVYPGVVVARGCFIPPCPPPPMVFIDVKALPEAPAGSDADLIAKGERRAP